MASAEVTMIPQTYTELTGEEEIKKMNKILECWDNVLAFFGSTTLMRLQVLPLVLESPINNEHLIPQLNKYQQMEEWTSMPRSLLSGTKVSLDN